MNRYAQKQVSAEQEPIKPHISEIYTDAVIPSDHEIRFLGNA